MCVFYDSSMQFPFRDDSVLPTTDARRDYHVGDSRLPRFTREFDHSLTIRISECFSSLISPGRRTRERANVLEAEQSSRKLRLICLASAVMSGYLRVHELLEDELQNPLDPSAEEAAHDEELFDFAFGHNHMLLMAQFVLRSFRRRSRTSNLAAPTLLVPRSTRSHA